MPEKEELHLLPDTRRKIEVRTPGRNRSVAGAFAFLILIAVVYGVFAGLTRSLAGETRSIDEQIAAIEKARDEKKEEKLLVTKERLDLVGSLLDKHVRWTRALDRIEKMTHPQVQFENLVLRNTKNEIDFKGLAQGYSAVAKQIAAFYADPLITDVVLGKLDGTPSGKLEFTMTLTIDISKLIFESDDE